MPSPAPIQAKSPRPLLAYRMHYLHFDVMPKTITIRGVPDETRDELAARAALTGRSLQEYLRNQLIHIAGQPDVEVVLARVRDRKKRTGSELKATEILAHRDAEGR